MRVSRSFSDTSEAVTLSRPGVDERYVSSRTTGGDNLAVFKDFEPGNASVLSQFVFGGCRFHDQAVSLMGDGLWPVTWIHGDGCSGESVSGMQAVTVAGPDVKGVTLDGAHVGCWFEDEDAAYCYLGGILPSDRNRGRTDQAEDVFLRLEKALATVGMEYTDVVRTWLFLEQLLDWYGEFNEVRTAFYEERGVFDRLVPASTGIGAANPGDAALIAGAIAIKPKHDRVKAFAVPSPLQCPATSYRSSFSRAAEVEMPDRRYLYISGTASINADGTSAHLGDVDKQIDLTMRVATALLESRGMGWGDVVRAIAYFKDMRDGPRFADYCRAEGLPTFPVALAHAAVCRDDLLFEIEADAAQPIDP